jgi:Ca-activated chloride channel homolog
MRVLSPRTVAGGLLAALLTLMLAGCAGSSSTDDADSKEAPAGASSEGAASQHPEMHAADPNRPESPVAVRSAAQDAVAAYLYPPPLPWLPVEPIDRERHPQFDDNPVYQAHADPVSTFSIDVDTASYSRMRRFLNNGQLPMIDAIRTEELVNYFDYDYAPPTDRTQPFAVQMELGPSPWHAERHLLHIGLKGFERPAAELPPANLVFLVDVSGSMQGPDRLGLLKASLKLLIRQLRAEDRISIAVYAGAAGTVLEPTPGNQHAKILAALEALQAGGSTNGGAGIQLAYSLARQSFIENGINRVILASDGDYNVGVVDQRALKQLIERERADGVALTVLGFGMGNYNDALMQELVQAGNGNAAYIDTLSEGRKVLVEELARTLEIIAYDVKIQVEFNPARVAEYRLIGYETRQLAREDFSNDRVDAGDIGAGHTVTAIYEVTLQGSAATRIEPLRYQAQPAVAAATTDEIAFVRLRYKLPGESRSRLIERAVASTDLIMDLAATSDNFRFAAAVAGFGQLLRGGRYTDNLGYADVVALARGARGADPFGYRGEFLGLAGTAAALSGQLVGQN